MFRAVPTTGGDRERRMWQNDREMGVEKAGSIVAENARREVMAVAVLRSQGNNS